mgnify:CR=1 FL=1
MITRRLSGSAPHARGRLTRLVPIRPASRISPARAGTTPQPANPCPARSDQPRTRGDDMPSHGCSAWLTGSAPHARGRRPLDDLRQLPQGISPARAGTTTSTLSDGVTIADQPRTRGDDPVVVARPAEVALTGISPARAGTTSCMSYPKMLIADQPRTRGDDEPPRTSVPPAPGSAPHARGRLASPALATSHRRISPARAGTTPWQP